MAESRAALLAKELNKLKKDELIELILHQKLPVSVNSEELINFVSKLRKENTSVTNSKKDVYYDSHDLPPVECSCEKRLGEFNTLQKLTYHLEKRTQEQEELILLLKQRNQHQFVNNIKSQTPSGDITQNTRSINSNNTDNPTKQKLYSTMAKTEAAKTEATKNETKKETDTRTRISQEQHKNGWQNTTTNKNMSNYSRRRPIIGNGKKSTAVLKTNSKLGYLHVYRCSSEVTSEDLTNVLKETAPDINFKPEIWNKTDTSVSFKVSFPIEHYKEVYNPDLWPAGAAVRRFQFHKKTNFQDATLDCVMT